MKNSYRTHIFLFLISLAIGLAAQPALADIITMSAFLDGNNEVPAVVTGATGLATLTLDTDNGTLAAIPLHLEFTGLSSAQTAVHIHQAGVGVNGPVIITLPMGTPVDTTIALDLASYAALAGGNLYVNVHSANFPGGEIRGNFEITNTVDNDNPTWGSMKALFR